MKTTLSLLIIVLMAFTASAAGPRYTGTFIGDGGSVSNTTDTTAFRYLRSVPLGNGGSGGSGRPAGFYFKTSPDALNWSTILASEASPWVATNANDNVFGPAVIWWRSNFWLAYDVDCVGGQSNRFGLVRSSDLVNWTNLGYISLNITPSGPICGLNWWVENNVPYLLLTPNAQVTGTNKVYVTWPLDNAMATWEDPIAIANRGSYNGPYDGALAKVGNTYFMLAASVTPLTEEYIGTSPTNTFTLVTTNLLNGEAYESYNIVQIGANRWRVLMQGDNAGVSQAFYMDTSDFTNFTTRLPLVEAGAIGNHSFAFQLDKQAANVVQAASQTFIPRQRTISYTVQTTPSAPRKYGLTNSVGGGVIACLRANVLAFGTNATWLSGGSWDITGLLAMDAASDIAFGCVTNTSFSATNTMSASMTNLLIAGPSGPGTIPIMVVQVDGPSDQTVNWMITETRSDVAAPIVPFGAVPQSFDDLLKYSRVVQASNVVSGGKLALPMIRITHPTNATTVVNLGLDANGNVSSNAVPVGGGGGSGTASNLFASTGQMSMYFTNAAGAETKIQQWGVGPTYGEWSLGGSVMSFQVGDGEFSTNTLSLDNFKVLMSWDGIIKATSFAYTNTAAAPNSNSFYVIFGNSAGVTNHLIRNVTGNLTDYWCEGTNVYSKALAP